MNYSIEDHILHKDGNPVSWKKSPNYSRHSDGSPVIIVPELVVIHYTASDGLQGTLEWLCKPQGSRSVSAHFVVATNGVVWQLGKCNHRLYHAGSSSWEGRSDCNSFSVGIENMGWGKDWPDAQIRTNIGILIALHWAYPTISAIAGHEDVAPGRKSDPGPLYPWDRIYAELADAGIKYE